MRAALVAFAFGWALSGCLELPSPPATPSDPGTIPNGVPAPTWSVGKQWTVRVEDVSTGENSTESYRVQGARWWEGLRVYEVEFNESAYPRSTIQYFEVETLNHIWDFCGQPRGDGPCKGRHRILDFPLYDGKTWVFNYVAADIVFTYQVEATRLQNYTFAENSPSEAWALKVTSRQAGGDSLVRELVFHMGVGIVVEETRFQAGSIDTRRTVTQHSAP